MLRHKLAQQLCQAVLWEDVVWQMEKMGVTHLIEVGPGHTLAGFVRKTTRLIKVNNVEDEVTFKEVLNWLDDAKGGEKAS